MVRYWTRAIQWSRVIFSDALTISLGRYSELVFVRTYKHENYTPCCTQCVHGAPKSKFLYWGCIGFGKIGHLVEVDGDMNQDQCINRFNKLLLPSARDIFLRAQPDYIYQDDNFPPHRVRRSPNWRENQQFQHVHWSAYSPDMNVIYTVCN